MSCVHHRELLDLWGEFNNVSLEISSFIILGLKAVHDGINCKQYQDDLSNDANSESARQTKELLQELIDKEEALNCPTCQVRAVEMLSKIVLIILTQFTDISS